MGEDHTRADYVAPRDLRTSRRDLAGHLRRGFAEYLYPSLRRCLNNRICLQSARIRSVLQDQIAHLDHVENEIAIFPHSSTASANTRSATRGRRPASVVTSTSQPRLS